jgi:hypothetical protein
MADKATPSYEIVDHEFDVVVVGAGGAQDLVARKRG